MRRPEGQTWAIPGQHLGAPAFGERWVRVRTRADQCSGRASSLAAPERWAPPREVAAIVLPLAVALPIAAVPALDIKAARRRIRCFGFREFDLAPPHKKVGAARQWRRSFNRYCHKCQVTLDYFRAHK